MPSCAAVYAPTHSLPHSVPHFLTHSFIHSLTHSITHSLTHSLIHSLTYSLICPSFHSCIHDHCFIRPAHLFNSEPHIHPLHVISSFSAGNYTCRQHVSSWVLQPLCPLAGAAAGAHTQVQPAAAPQVPHSQHRHIWGAPLCFCSCMQAATAGRPHTWGPPRRFSC